MAYRAYHVTSARNRNSILQHGLDWRRKGMEPGIAGADEGEGERIFLVEDLEQADFFVWMGRTRFQAVDVWEVTLARDPAADDGPFGEMDGFLYTTQPIPPERVRLVRSES